MNSIIREIATALDNQIRGDYTINENLTADQIKMINDFVGSFNETMGVFPFPLKRR
ncbi:hypothetical protein [Candidatus Nitrosocosmicus sp. R]